MEVEQIVLQNNVFAGIHSDEKTGGAMNHWQAMATGDCWGDGPYVWVGVTRWEAECSVSRLRGEEIGHGGESKGVCWELLFEMRGMCSLKMSVNRII